MGASGLELALDHVIDCSSRAPAEARRAVEKLAAYADSAVLRDTMLVVSELVTNSVRHSGSEEPIRLRAWTRASGLKVEVSDGGFGFEPGSHDRGHEYEGGRGLMILDALADRWGVSNDDQTRVWFELGSGAARGRRAQAG